MATNVAAITLAAITMRGYALASVVLSCSGIMEGPEISAKQGYVLSITVDPVKKTVMIDDTEPIPIQDDATNNTITFGNATSRTFGILNRVTGSIFVSTFQPVTTYRGVCNQD